MKNIIGLKELRQNMGNWIDEVQKGKSFVVVRKTKPVFKIVPPELEERWETIADLSTITKDGVSAREVLRSLRKLNA